MPYLEVDVYPLNRPSAALMTVETCAERTTDPTLARDK